MNTIPGTKLIVFDVDDTLAEGKIWQRLTTALGWSWDIHQKIYHERLAGLRTYKDTHALVLSEYKKTGNAYRAFIENILTQTVLKPYAKELMNLLRQNGFTVHLLSGGFKMHVAEVARQLGVDGYSASRDFIFDSGGNLLDITGNESDRSWKSEELIRICDQYSIDRDAVYIVGD